MLYYVYNTSFMNGNKIESCIFIFCCIGSIFIRSYFIFICTSISYSMYIFNLYIIFFTFFIHLFLYFILHLSIDTTYILFYYIHFIIHLL